MAGNRNILVSARRKARRYAKISKDYEYWTRRVKGMVDRAESDDWGTFVVACALLESAVPQDVRARVEREARLDELEDEYCQQMERRHHDCLKACLVSAAVLCSVGVAIWVLMVESAIHGIPGDAFGWIHRLGFQGNWISLTTARLKCPLLRPVCLPVFSVLGALAAGCSLGTLGDKGKLSKGVAIFLSCIVGFECAFVCPALPPVALVLAWCAWRLLDIAKPAALDRIPRQGLINGEYGRRAFALDPHAPLFVKNAIRLAGIFRDSMGYAGGIAREALNRRQTDYGAFVVYNAILSECWAQRQAEEKARAEEEEAALEAKMAAGNNAAEDGEEVADEVTEILEEHQKFNLGALMEDSGFEIGCSVVVALLVGIAIVAMMDIQILATEVWPTAALVLFTVALLAFCTVIGYRTARRAFLVHGLDLRQKFVVALARSAWFSAWLVFLSMSAIKMGSVFVG